jgi:hypothetical protein
MFYGISEMIDCVYGMKTNMDETHEEKLKAAIAYLGNKYVLAIPVEKK